MAEQTTAIANADGSTLGATESLRLAGENVREACAACTREASARIGSLTAAVKAVPAKVRARIEAKRARFRDALQRKAGGAFLTWEEIERVRRLAVQGALSAHERETAKRIADGLGDYIVRTVPAASVRKDFRQGIDLIGRFAAADEVERAAWEALSLEDLEAAASAGAFGGVSEIAADGRESWRKHVLFEAARESGALLSLLVHAAHVYSIADIEKLGEGFAAAGERKEADALDISAGIIWFDGDDMQRMNIPAGDQAEENARKLVLAQAQIVERALHPVDVPALECDGHIVERFDSVTSADDVAAMMEALRNLAYWRTRIDAIAEKACDAEK